MSVVWENAPISANEVTRALATSRQWTLTTVRTLLRRLVEKKALEQTVDGKRYLYSPLVSMEACARSEGESLLARLTGRTPSIALIHMVREAELSDKDIRELKKILKDKEKK